MSFASGFGFAGDFLTLVGGLFLAWDAMTGEVDFVKFSKTSRTLKDPVMEGVKLRKNKMVVVDEKDLEQASLRVKSWRAITGCMILCAGFVCLFVSRWIETASH